MTLVIIPARLDSKRLPNKPLLKIGSKSIISHVVDRARKAGLEPIVAFNDHKFMQQVERNSVFCVFTGEAATGTDRVAMAADIVDPDKKHDLIINLQGDMPFIDPNDLKAFVSWAEAANKGKMEFAGTAFYTKKLTNVQMFTNTHFKRMQIDCHVGIYAFSRKALEKFKTTERSIDERQSDLEQLRIPFWWNFFRMKNEVLEVNTQEDLEFAQRIARYANS